MKKQDWETKEKEFLEMRKSANENKKNVEAQLEELDVFLKAIRREIQTLK